MRFLIPVLLASLMAWPAFAVNDWGYPGCSDGTAVGSGKICFDMDSSLPSPYTAKFSVTSSAAIACLHPDVTLAGVPGGANPVTAEVWYCPNGGTTTATCGTQVCAQASCTLNGLNGLPSAQRACVVLGPGPYLVYFPTLPDAAEVGLFSVGGSP